MRSGDAKPAPPRQTVPHPADRVEPGGARPGAGRGASRPGGRRGAGPEHARPWRDATPGHSTAREDGPPHPPQAGAPRRLHRRQRDGGPAPADLPPLTPVGARRGLVPMALAAALLLIAYACGGGAAPPTATPCPSPSATATPCPSPAASPSPSPGPTATASPEPSPSPSPSPTTVPGFTYVVQPGDTLSPIPSRLETTVE